MRSYRITNRVSGMEMGTYLAADEQGALDAFARAAGYGSYAEACEVAPVADREIEAELVEDASEAASA